MNAVRLYIDWDVTDQRIIPQTRSYGDSMSRLMQMVLLESVDSWSQFPPQYDIGAAQLGPNCQVSTCNAPRCHDVEHLQDSPGIHGGGESSIPSRTCGLTLQRRGPLRVMDPGLWPIPYLSD